MSTIIANNLSDGANSVASTTLALASPKVRGFITYSGGTPTAQSVEEVSSITDASVGTMAVNFKSAFVSANFTNLMASQYTGITNGAFNQCGARTTFSATLQHFQNSTQADPVNFDIAAIGELA